MLQSSFMSALPFLVADKIIFMSSALPAAVNKTVTSCHSHDINALKNMEKVNPISHTTNTTAQH